MKSSKTRSLIFLLLSSLLLLASCSKGPSELVKREMADHALGVCRSTYGVSECDRDSVTVEKYHQRSITDQQKANGITERWCACGVDIKATINGQVAQLSETGNGKTLRAVFVICRGDKCDVGSDLYDSCPCD